jgi:hypothetical protein
VYIFLTTMSCCCVHDACMCCSLCTAAAVAAVLEVLLLHPFRSEMLRCCELCVLWLHAMLLLHSACTKVNPRILKPVRDVVPAGRVCACVRSCSVSQANAAGVKVPSHVVHMYR